MERVNSYNPARGGGGGDNWTTGAIGRAKLQSHHHHQQTNIQFFLQAGCPSCRPTNSVKALKGKYGLAYPRSPGVFQLRLWPLTDTDDLLLEKLLVSNIKQLRQPWWVTCTSIFSSYSSAIHSFDRRSSSFSCSKALPSSATKWSLFSLSSSWPDTSTALSAVSNFPLESSTLLAVAELLSDWMPLLAGAEPLQQAADAEESVTTAEPSSIAPSYTPTQTRSSRIIYNIAIGKKLLQCLISDGKETITTYSYSLHHAAGRSSTSPGHWEMGNGKRISSLIDYLDSSFDFETNSSLTSLLVTFLFQQLAVVCLPTNRHLVILTDGK